MCWSGALPPATSNFLWGKRRDPKKCLQCKREAKIISSNSLHLLLNVSFLKKWKVDLPKSKRTLSLGKVLPDLETGDERTRFQSQHLKLGGERKETQESQSATYILGDPGKWLSLNLSFSLYKMGLKELIPGMCWAQSWDNWHTKFLFSLLSCLGLCLYLSDCEWGSNLPCLPPQTKQQKETTHLEKAHALYI